MKNVPYIIAIIWGLILVVLGIINASFQTVCYGLTFAILVAAVWIMDNYTRNLESINNNLLEAAEEALNIAREANESDQKHINMVEGLNKVMEMLLKDCDFDTVVKLNAVLEEHNLRVQEDENGELRLFVKK
jgi:hypothetical protein